MRTMKKCRSVTSPQDKLHYPVSTAGHIFGAQEVEQQIQEAPAAMKASL